MSNTAQKLSSSRIGRPSRGYTLEKDMLSPAWRNPHSHAAAVAQMKRFCIERGAWMDENIDILRQYSHESKNKKFNH